MALWFALLGVGCSVESIGGWGPGSPDAGPNLTPDDLAAGGCVRSGVDTAHVHAEPRADAPVVGAVTAGTSFTIVEWSSESGENWLQVQGASVAGWIRAAYLGPCEDRPSAQEEPAPEEMPEEIEGGLPFLLPWEAGRAFLVTTGHNVGAHTGPNGAWAWDFGLPNRTPVLAAHDGVVRLAKFSSSSAACNFDNWPNANWVVIVRDDGLESLYLHLAPSEPIVSVGQTVKRGQLIGYSGNTGYTCGTGGGYHLHFQIQQALPQGNSSAFSTTVHQYFYDTGVPLDPGPGTSPISANGAGSTPTSVALAAPESDGHCGGLFDIADIEAASRGLPRK